MNHTTSRGFPTRFYGAPRVYFLAICRECTPSLPMPFAAASERDEWADEHRTTGHSVDCAVDVVP